MISPRSLQVVFEAQPPRTPFVAGGSASQSGPCPNPYGYGDHPLAWDYPTHLRACLKTQKSPMNLHILLYFFDHLPQQTGDAIHS